MAKLKSGTRIYGTSTIDTSVVVGSAVTINSSGINASGIITATSFSGTLSGYASTAGIATYATNSGIATSVIGGIGSIAQLQVTGISTFSNGPVFIGGGTSTGTAGQVLQVSGINSSVYIGGNLGIGTTNPTTRLQVVGDVRVSGVVTTSQLDLTANATANDSVLQLSGTPSGTSSTNGLLGIGTLNFSDTDIVANFTHNVNSYAQVILQNRNSGSTASADFIVNNDRTGGTAYYGDFGINATTYSGSSPFNDPDGTYLYAAGGSLTVGTLDALDFRVATGTGAGSTIRLVVKGTSGNIGFGTTNPTSLLQVQGNTLITGIATVNSNFVVNGNTLVADATNNRVGILTTTPIQQFQVGAAGTNVVVVTGIGSVGIGTTNPQYQLQVQGNARITGAFYDSTNAPGTPGQVLQSTQTGTLWAAASNASAGGGIFDTSIDNVLYIQPTGTLDIVGVGTTTTQITTLPAGSSEYIIHSMHVTNISNGDAEITAGFIMNARSVPATISVSAGSSGGAGIHTFTVGSASSIRIGMAVTGTGNIGETTGIGSTAGFQFNTYVTSVDGNTITLDKPMSGTATGVLRFSPTSLVSSRLPVPVGSAVELLKQPMVLNALDSIVLQSTGAGSGIGSTSTNAVSQTANSNFLTVAAGAAITNFIASGMLVQATGINTGIQTNTFVGVGWTPGSLSIPLTRPATTTIASTSFSFTEVVFPQDGALQVTITYQSTSDTTYLNGTGTVVGIVTLASLASSPILGITSTVPLPYYGTGNSFPSTIQSIRVSNISDRTIYPGGDYPVWVGIGNSDTIFSWLAYNMIIPKNSSIELCEGPKRLGIGQSIFAYSDTPNAIEIQIAGKQKTI